LDILKILIENGYSRNKYVFINTVNGNRLGILKLAIDNGCSLWNFNDLLITKINQINHEKLRASASKLINW
jgi:hypothetical protein